jgi:hypothetical protein
MGAVASPSRGTERADSSPAPTTLVPARLTALDLGAQVRDGTLDERLVFVDGVLEAAPVRCGSLSEARQARDGPCVELSVAGLGLPVWAGAAVLPWRGLPPPGAWIVTVARAGGLVYLGSLVPDAAVLDDVAELDRRLTTGALADPPGTLFQLTSWLVARPTSPCVQHVPAGSSACPIPGPFLAADEPLAGGILASARGAPVDLAHPVIDVGPDPVTAPGTFLLTPPDGCDLLDPAALDGCPPGAPWVVVARYEPSRSVRVQVP